jgi:hypothetical protein
VLLLTIVLPSRASAEPAELFFFSPDWTTGNLNVLAEAVDRYIAENELSLKFQAFARYEDFKSQVEVRRPAFVIVPAWVESDGSLGVSLSKIARPVRDGKTSYRKALMARVSVTSTTELNGASIAAAVIGTGPEDPKSLLGHFGLAASNADIIPVPKDIDALLALSFGQVDAALVTPAQLEMLQQVNPNSTKNLHVLDFSPAVPFPSVESTPYASSDDIADLQRSLPALEQSGSGRALLKVLGFDRFEKVTNDSGASYLSRVVVTTLYMGSQR